MGKPRLAENESDLWKAAHEAFLYWWQFGYYIELNTLGEGIFSFDRNGNLIQMLGTKKLPLFDSKPDLKVLDKAFATDTVEITAKKMGKSAYAGDSYPDYLLHSCSGNSFKRR